MINTTDKNTFLETMNQMYEEREAIFKKREEEYQKQKHTLSVILNQIQQEKEEFLDQSRMELEIAKNEKIKAQQVKEEFEHRLVLLELLLNQQGEDSTKVIEFFHSLVEGQADAAGLSTENSQLKTENQQLREEKLLLQEENQELTEAAASFEQERKKLLGLIAKLRNKEKTEKLSNVQYQDIPKEEPQHETEESVYEELTASILKSYLQKNESRCEHMEIRHSEDCEQLHFTIGGLKFVFLFSFPASFEISAVRKNGHVLQKVLAKMNEKYPDVKFQYEDGKVYATGYFMNTIRPEHLMERVDTISDCFKQ